MLHGFSIIALSLFSALALASPALEPRQIVDTTVHCGQWDTVTVGPYSLLLDLWGESGATSGSQCAHIVSLSSSTIAWVTNWTWTGGTGVKSFSNIQLNQNIGKQLSAISSIPSTWEWSYTLSNSAVADVAYDLFTADTSTGNNVNEIMIWLANYNAGPISAQYGSNGQPVPIVSDLQLASNSWNLYFGSNGANNVYSFLPTSGTISSFSGDINTFLEYLTSKQNVSSSQYLKTAQAGTEPTSGTGALTSTYSLIIN